ncbi:unnamed protein product [Pleuronectes platessa]|uniref:Uncharacterized protein n=1 Tax=Pleuronectes platessa TaxID=8262 RepID=A0A9N7TKN8_PLEPL|nr:unnamed protein product [Pleuronectes platessa]
MRDPWDSPVAGLQTGWHPQSSFFILETAVVSVTTRLANAGVGGELDGPICVFVRLFSGLIPGAHTVESPGCPTLPDQQLHNRRVWTLSVLKERFLKMDQPYVRHPGALNELFIEVGVDIPSLPARSTQSQGQPPADRSTIMGDFVW